MKDTNPNNSFRSIPDQITFTENQVLLSDILRLLPVVISAGVVTFIIANILNLDFSLFAPLYPLETLLEESYSPIDRMLKVCLCSCLLPQLVSFLSYLNSFFKTFEVTYAILAVFPVLYSIAYLTCFWFFSCLILIIFVQPII